LLLRKSPFVFSGFIRLDLNGILPLTLYYLIRIEFPIEFFHVEFMLEEA